MDELFAAIADDVETLVTKSKPSHWAELSVDRDRAVIKQQVLNRAMSLGAYGQKESGPGLVQGPMGSRLIAWSTGSMASPQAVPRTLLKFFEGCRPSRVAFPRRRPPSRVERRPNSLVRAWFNPVTS